MKTTLVVILALVLTACGDGDGGDSGGVSVSGDSNVVTVVDVQEASFECSGIQVRRFRVSEDEETDELVGSFCVEPEEQENCDQCFASLEELALLGYKSSEGCVEDLVLQGVCGEPSAIAQAQASAGEE